MSCIRWIRVLSIAGMLLLLAPRAARTESQIFLKDGRVIKVETFWREEGAVKYESFGGVIGIPLDQVEKIVTPDMLAFEEARKTDTVKGYEDFLQMHPRSEYAEEAKKRIKALEFEEVTRMNSASIYLAYIRRNPSSIYLDEAKERAEVLIFQAAVRKNSEADYREYLEIYPDGQFAPAARKAVALLKAGTLLQSTAIPEIEAYLREFPESSFRQQLEDRIAFLLSESEAQAEAKRAQEQKARELRALEASKRRGRWVWIAGILAFLAALGAGVGWFLWKKKGGIPLPRTKPASDEPEVPQAEPESPAEKGPVRYEDILGVPRRERTQALPGPEVPGRPASLPAPEAPSEAASGVESGSAASPFALEQGPPPADPEESAILLGHPSAEGTPDAPPNSEIDLSDHETEFKLDLEDVSSDPPPSEEGTDLSGGDLPGLFDEEAEEIKKRRGGGFREG